MRQACLAVRYAHRSGVCHRDLRLENIMLQQDILRDQWGKGSPDRNRERFSLMIFGEPSDTEPWSWRWEGHHLTITYTLVGDRIISTTPKAFSRAAMMK